MSDSVFTGSVVVGSEVAAGRVDESGLPQLPAVPDAGGQRQDALADTDPDTVGDVPAVQFEGELAFGGLIDRFDPLAHATQVSEPAGLVLAVGPDPGGVQRADQRFEFAPRERLCR
jgi:hypothetical protein